MNSKLLICGTEYGLWHRSCSYSYNSLGLESRVITKLEVILSRPPREPMGRHRYAGRTLENI